VTWVSDESIARLRRVAEEPDLTGTRYRTVREIGRGGHGLIYEVEDVELARIIALKVSNFASTNLDSLRAEARVIASLEHPGIVPIHEVGVLPDERVYYTMKLVRGVRLDQWQEGPWSLSARLRLFVKICEAVAFAHTRGVVHRDLKPANVMVGDLGEVFVMDWGVAGVATPEFMAPEQKHGEARPQSDVFALGRMLALLVPQENQTRRLRAVIARATAADSSVRYESAGELATDLLHLMDDEPVSAYKENAFDRAGRWLQRNRVLVALISAYLVMRVVVFLWFRL
jgi:serine/threonine-protein kinase